MHRDDGTFPQLHVKGKLLALSLPPSFLCLQASEINSVTLNTKIIYCKDIGSLQNGRKG